MNNQSNPRFDEEMAAESQPNPQHRIDFHKIINGVDTRILLGAILIIVIFLVLMMTDQVSFNIGMGEFNTAYQSMTD